MVCYQVNSAVVCRTWCVIRLILRLFVARVVLAGLILRLFVARVVLTGLILRLFVARGVLAGLF